MVILHDCLVISKPKAKTIHKIAPRPALSPFTAGYRELVDAGYSVLAIWPGFKKPGTYYNGRWSDAVGWTQYATAPAKPNVLENWCRAPGAGIGIALGSPAGEHDGIHYVTAVLDFDAIDPDLLAALLAEAPYSPMVRVGKKGEARVYRVAEGFASASFNIGDDRVLDVLAKGRQTVMPPTIHPAGMAYHWTNGSRIVPADSLPVLTDGHMAALRDVLTAFGWRAGSGQPAASAPAGEAPSGAASGDDDLRDVKDAALANFDAWVPALGLHGCRRKHGGSYEAVATWRPSSGGRPLADRKPNLSFHRTGIKDFGDGDRGYSPIDVVMAARGCSVGEAAHWLREKLGMLIGDDALLSPEAIERGLARSAAAREARDQPGATSTIEDETGVVRDATTGALVGATNDNRPASADLFPDALTRVPGLLGDVIEWIVATSRNPNRVIALGAALTVLGTAAGRRDAGPTRSGTSLFVLVLAESGAGKQHGLNQIPRLLKAAGMDHCRGPQECGSVQALNKHLVKKPLSCCAQDEYGAFLQRINSRKAGGHEKAIAKTLRNVWGVNFGDTQTTDFSGTPGQTIYAPAMSIFAVSTPGSFYKSLSGSDIEDGSLNRYLLLNADSEVDDVEPELDDMIVPPDLADGIGFVFTARDRPLVLLDENPAEREVFPAIIEWQDYEAKAVHTAMVADVKQIRLADAERANFYRRTVEMALRLATICAVGRDTDNPTVDAGDMAWGRDVALWSAARMATQAGDFISDNPTGELWSKVKAKLRETGGSRLKRDIGRLLTMNKRELNDTLAGMEEANLITVESRRSVGSTKPAIWLHLV